LNGDAATLSEDEANVELAKAIEASIHTKMSEEIEAACESKGKKTTKGKGKARAQASQSETGLAEKSQAKPSRPKSKFVADVTLPDASLVAPGKSLVKTWRIKNDGKAAWPRGTRLVCVGGASFGTSKDGVAIPQVKSGEEIDYSINITAPSIPGRYVSYWRMMTPDNRRFGHRFWIDLTVKTIKAPPKAPYASASAGIPLAEPVKLAEAAMASEPFFEAAVQKLESMGFARSPKLFRLVREESGNVPMVVTRLLNSVSSSV
jgi:hypothetical protein